MSSPPVLETLLITYPITDVAQVTLNRPHKLNAMSLQMYHDIRSAFTYLDQDPNTRCIILTGSQKSFCSGTDLSEPFHSIYEDAARGAIDLQIRIKTLQDCISAVESCRKPVIAAVSGYCLGVAIDLVTSCCIRFCSKTAHFAVREVLIGMAADIGTLQRLPKVVGNESWVKELVYTGRDFYADEAYKEGLFSEVFEDFEKTLQAALRIGKEIAEKSPVAMVGCKANCNFAMSHSVKESLEFVVRWNGWGFQTKDMDDSVAAQKEKRKAKYPKL